VAALYRRKFLEERKEENRVIDKNNNWLFGTRS